MIYDVIIIGSGISGLYAAYNIKKLYPEKTFLVLEKNKKQWVGGRASNDMFYGTEIVTGAGIGRKRKDKLLYKLIRELGLQPNLFTSTKYYANNMNILDIERTMEFLKNKYQERAETMTFKQFATQHLGTKVYKQFLETSGYTDYEKEDVHETLYYYGMDDNYGSSEGFSVPWREMVLKLSNIIGYSHFKFSNAVSKINNMNGYFELETENGLKYLCNKVVVATTITGIRKLLALPIYNNIEGQPFLRLYGKFTKCSIPVLKEYVKGYTCVPGVLQKIIPMNADKGVYMIVYNDNKNTLALKNRLENTEENRDFYCRLVEKSLGIRSGLLQLVAIKDYYWNVGTHYYKPLPQIYNSRQEFITMAQHPYPNILVVGEVVSRKQGWTEGALESVHGVLTKKWINM